MLRPTPLLAVLLVAALGGACAGPTAPPAAGGSPAPATQPVSGTYTIKGTLNTEGLSVQQAGGLADADVYLDNLPNIRGKSKADGSFELTGVPAGEHFVVGEKGEFKVRQKVALAPEQPVADLKSLLLRRTGAVIGLVALEGGGGTLGADVFVAGSTMIAKAKENGAYGLANVAEGVYRVTATYPGYEPATLEVEVKAGRPSQLDLTLKKLDPSVALTTVKGTVTDGSGKAVPGATVSVRGTANLSTLADEQGRFLLGNLADGTYDLLVFAPGMTLHSRSVALAAAQGKEKDLGAIALGGAATAPTPTPSLPAPVTASPIVAPSAAPASVAPVASQAPVVTAPSTGPYGALDSQSLKPGGATRSTNAGLNAIGNQVYDVALGQSFKPSRSGSLQTLAFMIGAASGNLTVSVYEADRGGFPDATKLKGQVSLPSSEVQGFNDFTYFRFANPVALEAAKTYVAVVTCPGAAASVALSDKAGSGSKLSLSFASSGGEHLSWDTTPSNEGFEYLAHRVYLAP
jgi:hypothetical protein